MIFPLKSGIIWMSLWEGSPRRSAGLPRSLNQSIGWKGQNPLNNYMVYCLTNRVNGKKYIGITNNLKRRWRRHCFRNSAIGYAIRKYGRDNFRISVLYSSLPLLTAQVLEGRLIVEMNTLAPSGYNIASGGKGGSNPVAGLTDAQKAERNRKISEGNQGQKRSALQRRRISESLRGEKNPRFGKPGTMLGKEHTPEAKVKLSEAARGRRHSVETRRKMSESHKGKVLSDDHRQKMSKSKRGENHHFYGKTLSEEHRRKLSVSGKGKQVGENNPMHRDNIKRRFGATQLDLFERK